MRDFTLFQLLYTYMEERRVNGICENLKNDTEYLKTKQIESECCRQYNSLDLTDEQRIVIGQWIDSINALNGAYTEVVFRMAMQLSFSILLHLADWK